ncbi:MAG: hypothetical protein ACOYJH_04705 [Anaerovoracaceae bacterium]
MFKEKMYNGKVRYRDRYVDPLTEKRADERTARKILDEKIASAVNATSYDNITFRELAEKYTEWQRLNNKPQTVRSSAMYMSAECCGMFA